SNCTKQHLPVQAYFFFSQEAEKKKDYGLKPRQPIGNTTGFGLSLTRHTTESVMYPGTLGNAHRVSCCLSPGFNWREGGCSKNVFWVVSFSKRNSTSASKVPPLMM